jgi:low temperature requirement protein LtrA
MTDRPARSSRMVRNRASGIGTWRRVMMARDREQEYRSSTPLELFFDLCFVVAVAQAGNQLHHGLADAHGWHAWGELPGYLMVFFAIWWAWVNFTWFASAYDTDDVPYRITTLVQITGALILAAGVPRAFDRDQFGVVVIGYLVMRLAMVAQWLRAAWSDPTHRVTALRFAAPLVADPVTVIAVIMVILVIVTTTSRRVSGDGARS